MEKYADYKKYIYRPDCREVTRHVVKIRLNATASNVRQALNEVPDDAVVTIVADNTDIGDYIEIYFRQEKLQGVS